MPSFGRRWPSRAGGSRATTGVGLSTFLAQGSGTLVRRAAVLALGGDAVFALIRAVQLFVPELNSRWFRLDVDGSIPEFFQYAKLLAIAALLAHLAIATGRRSFLAWAGIFVVLTLDDSLMFHERAGERFGPHLAPLIPSSVDSTALAEFLFLVVLGSFIVAVAIVAMVRSPGPFRRFTVDLMLLLGLAAAFAGGLDLVHGLLSLAYVANTLLAVVEDGGEMVAVSLIAIYVALVVDRRADLAHWLFDVRRLGA